MKYIQLTKEQLEELHKEFALFLAAQSIDEKEWKTIVKEKPELADKELNAFSDFVWEKVLNKANYLEHFSEKSINLFKCNEDNIERLVVNCNKDNFSFLNKQDFNWFIDNSKNSSLNYLKGSKKYTQEKNVEKFDLIQKGSAVSDGKLFESISKII